MKIHHFRAPNKNLRKIILLTILILATISLTQNGKADINPIQNNSNDKFLDIVLERDLFRIAISSKLIIQKEINLIDILLQSSIFLIGIYLARKIIEVWKNLLPKPYQRV